VIEFGMERGMGGKGLDSITSFGGIVGLEEGIYDWTPVLTVRVSDISLIVMLEAVAVVAVDIGGGESKGGCEPIRIVRSEN